MYEKVIKLNKKDNKGVISIDMDRVKDYFTDNNSKDRSTIINFYDGTSIIVADTVEQINVLLKGKEEGTIDNKGNFVTPK